MRKVNNLASGKYVIGVKAQDVGVIGGFLAILHVSNKVIATTSRSMIIRTRFRFHW